MRCNPTSMRPGTLAIVMGGLMAVACVAHGGETPTTGVRVRVKLDVSGELLAPAGPDAPPLREPVEMTARFDFSETAAAASGAGAGPGAVVCRTYRDATATMRVGDVPTTATLGGDARRILIARHGTTPMPYLADGFLSGEEADLLETPFDALLLDDLLPKQPVSIGQTWEIPADVTAGLLTIDTVESGAIVARLQEVSDGRAKVTFAGIIDGAADGVPTHATVEGSFAVAATVSVAIDTDADTDANAFADADADAFADAVSDSEAGADADTAVEPSNHELQGKVLQVSAVIRERRQASHVAPGFEVEARLSVACGPLDAAVEATLPTSAGTDGLRRRGEGAPGRVWYRDAKGRFDLVHDSRWRRVEDGANGLVMRLIDRGALVGQCSITSLPQSATATLPTRDDVQRDIERSLAGQVVRSDSAEESDRSDGLRVVRIASSGSAGRLPFRWIHYVLAAQDGSRVSVTFMCEDSMLSRFGDADRPLIEGLTLSAVHPATTPEGDPETTAAVPGESGFQTR